MCKLDAIYESIAMKHGFVMRDYVKYWTKVREGAETKKFTLTTAKHVKLSLDEYQQNKSIKASQ